MAATLPERDVYTVSRLNREARVLLERTMPALWIEGEMSNFAAPSSGHWYFSLKDTNAQVRCAMFRQRNQLSLCKPRDGLHVLARARVSLYEPRGEYQLLVDHLEEAGEGALRRRFDALKARLQQEGLFAAERKRPLPALPRRVGVITSPTGAAIRDILHVLRRRFCALPVLVYPVPVQGAGAAGQIASMIRLASARAECDVLVLARGGGSLEDLWAFNEEVVARALFDCRIPTVSGVGHEIDFTIADFVADVRAPTPSAAAELIAPNGQESLDRLVVLSRRSTRCLQRRLEDCGARHEWLARRLAQAHPGARLRHQAQRVDDFEQRFRRAVRAMLSRASSRLNTAQRQLVALSPLATLERGYAIVTRADDGALLRSSDEVSPGTRIEARLSRGRVRARVEDKD
ncbi:MAG TPA: exodeoxyribonuclease VII large subunit [Steroidobacteraceae bacterium]|nr:exodeoxyribonuclease VII large subunit [Steroidobacteraceae bacterium]